MAATLVLCRPVEASAAGDGEFSTGVAMEAGKMMSSRFMASV